MGTTNKQEILAKIQDLIISKGRKLPPIPHYSGLHETYILNTDFIIPEEQNHFTKFKLEIQRANNPHISPKYTMVWTYYNGKKVINHIYNAKYLPLERINNIYNNLYEYITNSSSSSASGNTTQEN